MHSDQNKQNKKPKQQLSFLRYSALGFQMIAIILFGVFGGIKLDEWAGLKFPVFTFALTIISVILAMYFAIKDVLKPRK